MPFPHSTLLFRIKQKNIFLFLLLLSSHFRFFLLLRVVTHHLYYVKRHTYTHRKNTNKSGIILLLPPTEKFSTPFQSQMEKICQNIIENEFRFMTPINYKHLLLFFIFPQRHSFHLFSLFFIIVVVVVVALLFSLIILRVYLFVFMFMRVYITLFHEKSIKCMEFSSFFMVCACGKFFHHQYTVYICRYINIFMCVAFTFLVFLFTFFIYFLLIAFQE